MANIEAEPGVPSPEGAPTVEQCQRAYEVTSRLWADAQEGYVFEDWKSRIATDGTVYLNEKKLKIATLELNHKKDTLDQSWMHARLTIYHHHADGMLQVTTSFDCTRDGRYLTEPVVKQNYEGDIIHSGPLNVGFASLRDEPFNALDCKGFIESCEMIAGKRKEPVRHKSWLKRLIDMA